MADYILESRMWVARRRPDVFAFFADPGNLAAVAPPWLRVRLDAPCPVMAAGAVIDLTVRALGVATRWRIFVREWDPPYRFVDVQLRGPFARWEHRHHFLEENGGTWVEDRVTYRPPLGVLGRLAHALVIGRRLRAAWAWRRRRVEALLGPVSSSAG